MNGMQNVPIANKSTGRCTNMRVFKMKDDICKHCGVVFATRGQFGEPQYRYGAQHKPDCPHGKKMSESKWIEMMRIADDRTQQTQ